MGGPLGGVGEARAEGLSLLDRSTVGAPAVSEVPKVELSHVSLRYGEHVILEDLSLRIPRNEILCVIGPSGSGKTTLLHIIAGLVAQSRGTVKIDGVEVRGPGPDRAMVFQEDAVFPWMTVRKNVEYGLRRKGLPGAEIDRRVTAILNVVGLVGAEKRFPRQLSGGMRKRVDLARALAVEPDLLLMDEPYGSLDAMTKERLQLEFLRICEEGRKRVDRWMTVVFVTHDLEEALFVGDRVVVVAANPGRIASSLSVPFEHPRALDLKRTEAFQQLRGELAARLEAVGANEDAAAGWTEDG